MTARRRSLRHWAAPALSVTFAAATAVLLATAVPGEFEASREVWLLSAGMVLAFFLSEAFVVHVDIGDGAHSASLVEIPLVLSMFWLPPHLVVGARVLGALLALWLRRRQSLGKLTFNVSMMSLEATVAVVVFSALAPQVGETPAVGVWGAAVLACLISSATSSSAVIAVISASTGEPVSRETLRGIALYAGPTTLATATLGVLAVLALHEDVTSVAPIVLLMLTAAAGYRQHVRLRKRHERLASLYGFVHEVSSSAAAHGAVRAVLTQTQLLLKSEVAVLTELVPDEGSEGQLTVVRHQLDATGKLHSQRHLLGAAEWPVSRCLLDQQPLLAPRGSVDPAVAAFLRAEGVQDGALVAVPAGSGECSGTLFVGGRRGEHSTFERADVIALEGLAGHAAVALHNGTLLEQLTYESRHDLLTGLPNRAEFQARLQLLLEDGGTAAVLFMDLDRFKDVNDTLGHHAGDSLLVVVAERLAAAAPALATVSRLGGDEFAVVLPGHSSEQAVAFAREVRDLLHVPVPLDDLSVDVGVSIGLAVAPEHGDDVQVLMRRADIAMYDAKAADGVAVYDAQRREPSSSRLALVAELREGLSTGQLRLHYQPQVRGTDGTVVRFESLLRWMHPERGLITPDEFLAVAERAGLLQEITQWVLAQALDDLLRWRLTGVDVGVCVNLSPRNLLEAGLAERVRSELAARQLPAGCLTLEITEATLMADPERSVQTLDQLRATGVRLSIDDFGTGYSSLSYLKHLPVDEVKVDRSFVKDLAEDPADVAIVRAIVALADSLNLEVVAEGVEDAASQALLVALGCPFLQGYYLARPMPETSVLSWLREAAERPWTASRQIGLAAVAPRSASA